MAASSVVNALPRPSAPASARPITASDPRLGAWKAFLGAHARLMRRLDEELRAAHRLSIAEYDALFQLASAPDRRLRMSVLADRVLLSRSGITRLVDRLESNGMVERIACTTDARGAEAALTAAGLERLRGAARTHLDGVARYFLDAIDVGDQAVIELALDRVINGLERPDRSVGRPEGSDRAGRSGEGGDVD